MESGFFSVYEVPPESYSRILDEEVARSELPYGYDTPPPPAGHNNHEGHEVKSYFKKRRK